MAIVNKVVVFSYTTLYRTGIYVKEKAKTKGSIMLHQDVATYYFIIADWLMHNNRMCMMTSTFQPLFPRSNIIDEYCLSLRLP